jgi:hypothetical protein
MAEKNKADLNAEIDSVKLELATLKTAIITALEFAEDNDFFEDMCDDGTDLVANLNKLLFREFDPPEDGEICVVLSFKEDALPYAVQTWLRKNVNSGDSIDADVVVEVLGEYIKYVELIRD